MSSSWRRPCAHVSPIAPKLRKDRGDRPGVVYRLIDTTSTIASLCIKKTTCQKDFIFLQLYAHHPHPRLDPTTTCPFSNASWIYPPDTGSPHGLVAGCQHNGGFAANRVRIWQRHQECLGHTASDLHHRAFNPGDIVGFS